MNDRIVKALITLSALCCLGGCAAQKPLNLSYTLDNVRLCNEKPFSQTGHVAHLKPNNYGDMASFSFACKEAKPMLDVNLITYESLPPDGPKIGVVIIRYREGYEATRQEFQNEMVGHAKLLGADIFVPRSDNDFKSQDLQAFFAYRSKALIKE